MDNVFEQAVYDFYNNNSKGSLLIQNTYGPPDEMPLDVYFREEADLSERESFALELCSGTILDVGAGLGALTIILQKQGYTVEALEISAQFCDIMQEIGVAKICQEDFLSRRPSQQFDTLLMMMNGFGLCGSFQRLPDLFKAIDRHLNLNGQVIFDSSDLSYIYEGEEKPTDQYFGEMDYRYEYDEVCGPWFKWLYIDAETLSIEANKYGFVLQVLFMDETGQYLGRLTRI